MTAAQVLDPILSPLAFGLLLALGLCFLRGRGPRWLRRAGYALTGLCIVLATPLGANALLALEERRVPATCALPGPTTVVLLAGGSRHASADAGDSGALNEASVQRTLEAAALALRTSAIQLVISGGMDKGPVAEGTRMAELAMRLGVPRATIRTETTSLTTWENAQRVRALIPALPQRIWLVTSALHMPRALIAFRAAGFTPCGYPVDYRVTAFEGPADAIPRGGAVAKSEGVLHELVGEIVYRWRAAHP